MNTVMLLFTVMIWSLFSRRDNSPDNLSGIEFEFK
ncbi:hypothetical protein CZ809_01763 [Photobacterium piscicola]|uniref:Uncharacterized protein n=1 Tax=Photobacterium piscicola TaxID=1378299 RepID=A0A1T5HZJ9_9GAMM|nr:hypothetical protein CZ809_01763 [Photobacterium piscicola]